MTVTFPGAPELTERDLTTIRRLVYAKSGIALHAGKGALVSARLQKRLRACGCRSFRQYIRLVQTDASGDELTAMLDAIATNHTAFFREPQHFQVLRDVVLPPLAARSSLINGWCAACATGEEAYSIAMILYGRLGDAAAYRTRVLASDISTKALAAARAGVYTARRLADVPKPDLLMHFEKAPEQPRGVLRVGDRLRQVVEFRRLNLLDPVPQGRLFDFIFCRNAMIYFDRPTQERVVWGLERQLAPGGYLFISHSESLNNMQHGLTWVAPAVYRRGAR